MTVSASRLSPGIKRLALVSVLVLGVAVVWVVIQDSKKGGERKTSNGGNDYVVMARRDHGLSRWDALLDACRKRARPIVMTTVAMGAGMLPIAIGLGTDPSFRAPMAVVVIGGLITSTFLSLLVIPVVLPLWMT